MKFLLKSVPEFPEFPEGRILPMKRFAIVLCLAMGPIAVACAAAQRSGDAASRVLAAEKARVDALDWSDLAALTKIMADDVTYVHASGRVDTKTSYLDAIRSGQLHYFSWRPMAPLQVRVLAGGNTAVLNGEYEIRVTDSRMQKAPFDVKVIVLSVYEHRGGRWQQVAWQSTRASRQ
jgi:ketosteroid isomerase-like protein